MATALVTDGANPPPAPLRIRLLSLFYEVMLLFAIVFVFSYLFLSLARDAQSGLARLVFQIYLLAVCGAYFMFCWVRSGQTLPMKTWRLRLVMSSGDPVSMSAAFRRYLVAVPAMLSGIGILWALFDRERLFLQDRIAGTRIVRLEPHRSEERGSGIEK
ncbi:MAG TPA: RDD family protein [Burkholderiales bacterium]|nr:RDD family protein [Burkholderiales bacterium]